MKVKVYLPPFCDHSQLDDSGCIDLPEGSRLKDLYKTVMISPPVRLLLITKVNYDAAKPGTILHEGDTVSVYWPLSGG